MDQLGWENAFARLVAEALGDAPFVLIDVGAAGGIAPAWGSFGQKLTGFGFDPNIEEVERLNGLGPPGGFRYIPGYVGLARDHPFSRQRRGKPRITRNPWARLAVTRSLQIQEAIRTGIQPSPNTPRSLPGGSDLGDLSNELTYTIDLPEFLQSEGIETVDFLKIDVDGADFDILQSFVGHFGKFGVLGVGVEINFFGSEADTTNTWHNIDRFLRSQGFEFIDLNLRRYPTQDLPGASRPGYSFPGYCDFGRPFQGDAFYARDICAPWESAFVENLRPERLLKSAALFGMFNSPDSAAEILITFRDRFASFVDVDAGLDLLATQVQQERPAMRNYWEYIRSFEKNGVVIPQLRPRSGSTIRALAPGAYQISRRLVFANASCSGTSIFEIQTPVDQWHHAVEFPLDSAGLSSDHCLSVLIQVAVHQGTIGVGILKNDGSVADEIKMDADDGPCLVELRTGRISDTGSLFVRNVSSIGESQLQMNLIAVAVTK